MTPSSSFRLKIKATVLSFFAYCRGLHLIPLSQAVAEAKQEIRAFADDLLLPEFFLMVQKTIKNSGKAIAGFLVIIGFVNFWLIFFSLIFLLVSVLVKWIGHISSTGITVDRMVVQYLCLLFSSPYIIFLVTVSIAFFLFWWTAKNQARKEKMTKIAVA